MEELDQERFDEIVEAVKKGECILFLGAGINHSPTNGCQYTWPQSDWLPLGSELSRMLADGTTYSRDYPTQADLENLQRVAQYIQLKDNNNRFRLNKKLRTHIPDTNQPSPLLIALAELNFPLIITTNFDRKFEDALKMAQAGKVSKVPKTPKVIIYEKADDARTPQCSQFSITEPTVFKIHGDIAYNPAEPNYSNDSMVITDEDYIHFIMRMRDKEESNPVPQGIMAKFKEWPILFIGYRLLDYNLRLLFKVIHWGQTAIPYGFSIDPYPDLMIRKIFEEKGHAFFLADDAWKFIPQLYEKVKNEKMPDYYG